MAADIRLAAQELFLHVFGPVEGPYGAAAYERMRELWSRCRERLGMVAAIGETGVGRDLPGDRRAAAAGSSPIAAQERPGPGVHQAVLRREHEMWCLAVALAPASPSPGWAELDRQWSEVFGSAPDPLLYEVRLYVAQTVPDDVQAEVQAAPDTAAAARGQLPPAEERDGWWDRGQMIGDRLALWETSPSDSRARRRVLMLAREGRGVELSEWAWHGGRLALPPLGRYLLHGSMLRYELGVWEREQRVRRLRGQADEAIAAVETEDSGPDEWSDLRAIDARLVDVSTALREMKLTVEIAADNMRSAFGPDAPAGQVPCMFNDDQGLARWFGQRLEDDAKYLEMARRRTDQKLDVPRSAVETRRPVVRAAVDPEAVRRPVPKRVDPDGRVVLAVADEWSPGRGGLSTLNRSLCKALAGAGAQVFCVVLTASDWDREDAAQAGVRLVAAPLLSGASEREALMRKPALPAGTTPDVIIGHGRVTGPAAQALAEDHFPNAARIHLIHMTPDEIEWWKLGRSDDAAVRAEERTRIELDLSRGAALVAAVGPRLHKTWSRELSVVPGHPDVVRMDPGFDRPDLDRPDLDRQPPPESPQILLLGRLEDAEIKGLDIAAAAIGAAVGQLAGRVPEPDVLLRGAPEGGAADLQARFRKWSGRRSLQVTVRNYSSDVGRLQEDLRRASLVLMPSRAEGFGLVGLEAILAGAPVLVSDRSGLGELLNGVLSREQAARLVVPVKDDPREDVPNWSTQIVSVLLNRPAAFATGSEVGRAMAEKRTWAEAATRLLDAARPTPGV